MFIFADNFVYGKMWFLYDKNLQKDLKSLFAILHLRWAEKYSASRIF